MNKILGRKKHKQKITEHQEQAKFVQWCKINRIPIAAVPNGIFLKDKATSYRIMAKMKKEGFAKGFPDLMVFLPSKVLFIEMKKRGGVLSREQKAWLKRLNELGQTAVVCYSAEEAMEVVEQWQD